MTVSGPNGWKQTLTLNRGKRTIAMQRLNSVLQYAKECSNSKETEPRIVPKIKKVFFEYPKIYRRLESEGVNWQR